MLHDITECMNVRLVWRICKKYSMFKIKDEKETANFRLKHKSFVIMNNKRKSLVTTLDQCAQKPKHKQQQNKNNKNCFGIWYLPFLLSPVTEFIKRNNNCIIICKLERNTNTFLIITYAYSQNSKLLLQRTLVKTSPALIFNITKGMVSRRKSDKCNFKPFFAAVIVNSQYKLTKDNVNYLLQVIYFRKI